MSGGDIFDRAFERLIGHEGGYTDNPKDPGNWTGRRVGVGELKGTKYGISAGSYPQIDIKGLTLAGAKDIYRRDYWGALRCDDLPPPIAYMTFDAGVNCGVGRSARWLQGAIGVAVDGSIGPRTIAAAKEAEGRQGGLTAIAVEFLSQRLMHHIMVADWASFGLGWARRLFRIPFEMMEIALWTR
ncbi:glycoside hydrolase family 108 protein [Falsiroseomonas sp. CW058]|uniref:glycoside hydrolase family 108 protein n=1 Tax=Falsiroseomonas sp. CW058 TaxID=3388664 RepID=UPI003D321EBA